MFRDTKRMGRWIVIAMAIGLFCCAEALADKPVKPPGGGGGDLPTYELIDLLGFANDGLGLQSYAQFVTNRDNNGGILIYGDSYLRYASGPAEKHPAMWRVAAAGSFPATDPLDLGLPSWAAELEPTGLNSSGVGVGRTRRAVEKDAQGNWVFPGYVDAPGMPYQELPAPVNRNAVALDINDGGEIVGHYTVLDPDDPDGLATVGGIWQLNPDGSISDPTSLGDFYPHDINNFGVMAGMSGGWPAIGWFEGGTLMIEQLDLSLRFWAADVNALNDYPIGDDRLAVVGHSSRDETGDHEAYDYWRGYVWRPFDLDNPSTVLGTLGGRTSEALGVNNSGEIVGWSDTKKHGQQAFIFKDGKMSNLNTMVDVGKNTLNQAWAINDDGDIVGFMHIPRPVSESRGFLLIPIEL